MSFGPGVERASPCGGVAFGDAALLTQADIRCHVRR